LPAIRVPTLVMSKERMRTESAAVAALTPAAHHVPIPGRGMAIMGNDFALEAIEDFLGGTSPRHISDTVLATLKLSASRCVPASTPASASSSTASPPASPSGSGTAFHPRGQRELKGVPGTWSIYAVSDA